MVSAVQGVVDVAEHGVDPLEHLVRHAGGAAAGDQRHVRAVGGCVAREAVQPVRNDQRKSPPLERQYDFRLIGALISAETQDAGWPEARAAGARHRYADLGHR